MDGDLNGKTIIKISCNGQFSCAISNDLKVYCWGANELNFFFFNILI
jgi:alpha-tubulin suppressor-like RCC1 family protein